VTNLERFSELTMSKQALLCFAVSTLRMMDLDILSSASSLQLEKIADLNNPNHPHIGIAKELVEDAFYDIMDEYKSVLKKSYSLN